MLIKDYKDCKFFVSEDGSTLCELLHSANDGVKLDYSIAYAIVEQGERTLSHQLTVPEVYYILEGGGMMHIGQEIVGVQSGQAVYIPANATQYIENTGRDALRFLCIVAPPYQAGLNKLIQ